MNQKVKRDYYLDILRIFAMFSVVMIHISCNIVAGFKPSSYQWHYANLFMTIARFAVPIFIMISGSLFLRNNKTNNLKYLYSKIFRILLILIVWNFFYAILVLVIKNGAPFSMSVLRTSLSLVLKGNVHYHLWYLYTIVGLYIVTPIIKIFVNHAKKQDVQYFLVIWFLFTSILPFLTHFNIFRHFLFLTKFDVAMIGNYIGYYVLGYYLSCQKIETKERKWIYILGILGLMFTYLTVFINYQRLGHYDDFLHTYMMPGIVMFSTALFIFVKEFCSKHEFHSHTKKLITWFSSISFGVYLVHDVFLSFFAPLGMKLSIINTNTWITLPIYFIVISIFSIITSWILLKIPIVKKYLV